ncbi:uncharacterized protein LOC115701583 [Cannabis sativa]|uniref:Uncharacterized protein n=1 Tax=Cannabis sativa TaxID=3483 RepID=A0A7J6H785_CANSA|nr:uncharacterized protein LOC115701583 [Cannabis sativa]XP_060958218.1 uncharacterized protein LOC115701583 [Cannabis sativa]XP_060958219.1 uncharacterized protein LOC115701583 [Cannabis sativa]KAF4390801.1 hypothetical protein G4B88_015691 [Cannabis sativa]
MGTEVQSKMYLPGYYSTKDISNNKASYGGWSLHHESSSSKNGQHYAMFSSKPAMEGMDYYACDKEKLRQTILKHESILRHQVHELHRLYKIQRDMMNEFQSKEQTKHLIPSGTSQSSLFPSGFSTEDDKRSWYISNLSGSSSVCGRPSSSSADVIQTHQSSMHERTTLSTYGLNQNSARLKDCESLDFKCKKTQRRLFDLEVPADEYVDDETEPDGEVEMSRTESCLINNSSEVTLAADKNVFNHTDDNGNKLTCNLYPRRTHYLADLNEPIEVEEVAASASVDTMGDKTRPESTQAYSAQIESKRSISDRFHLQDFRKPCDMSKAEASKTNEFVTCIPSDPNTAGKQITRRIFGVEVSEENNNSSVFAPPKGINLQNMSSVPKSDAAKSDLSSISCFNQNMISFQGGAQYDPQGYQSGPRNEPRKMEAPQGGLPWLRKAPPVNSKSLKEESEGSHQMKIDFTQSYSKQQCLNQTDTRRGPSQSPIQDSWLTTRGHDTEHRKAGTSDCSSVKRILGVPIFDFPSTHGSVSSVSGNNSPINVGSVKSDLACDSVSPRSQEQLKVIDSRKEVEKDRSYVRHEIDLNECITEEEEDQVTPAVSVAKPTTGIDLEAPVIVDSETGITSEEESQESELTKPLPHDKIDELAAEALIAISSVHVDYLHDDSATLDLQSDSSLDNSLLWFADFVSSYDETGTNKTNVCDEESVPDDIDDFEYIILNLPETKVEECCYQPQISENLDNLKEEDTPATRRPRRGHARRGRQKKDFQRDVLPGLVSLSRNEVTEDLQIIEGMVRTTGGTWQPSLTTRNGGKNGGGRGRRRCAPSPPAPVAAACNVQAQQPDSKESGLDESSLTGWGKRTRRPPRQRCPLSNSLLPLK